MDFYWLIVYQIETHPRKPEIFVKSWINERMSNMGFGNMQK